MAGRRSLLLLVLLSVAFTCVAKAQLVFEQSLPNAVDTIRGADDYRFVASLFPQHEGAFNPDVSAIMSKEDVAAATDHLNEVLDVQKATLVRQLPSVMAALQLWNIQIPKTTQLDATRLTFEDMQMPWANAISPTEIRLGARFLRGLVLGALREATIGEAAFSKLLKSYLGASQANPAGDAELERRARLYFAAGLRGQPEMRTEGDFSSHFRQVTDLLKETGETEGKGAIYDDLERRLQVAASGGPINGIDGMSMYDVFLNLDFHFSPALSFVLSHELGHVMLGHVPFPEGLSCTDLRQREEDADAFAVALLVYDVPGDMEVEAAALHALGVGPKPNSDDDKLGYGYEHAIRYGFALAGSSNSFDTTCSYPDHTHRIAHLDQLRATLVAIRAKAFERFYRGFVEAPAFVHTEESVEDLSTVHKQALTRRLAERCRSGPSSGAATLRKVDGLPFGYVVACADKAPTFLNDGSFRRSLGWDDSERFIRQYDTGFPDGMSAETLEMLQRRQ